MKLNNDIKILTGQQYLGISESRSMSSFNGYVKDNASGILLRVRRMHKKRLKKCKTNTIEQKS